MKKSNILLAVFIIFCFVLIEIFIPLSSFAQLRIENGIYIINNISGHAAINNRKKTQAREDAKRSTYNNIAENLLNELLPDIKNKADYNAVLNKVISNMPKLIKNFSINSEQVNGGEILINGTCKINANSFEKLIGQDIIKLIDKPRIIIHINEKVGGKNSSITQRHTAQIFEKAGYIVVNPNQARPLIDIAPSKAFNDPKLIYEIARTLRADAIILGQASSGAFATKKYLGAAFYGVSGQVQLKAIITQNSQEILSQKFSSSTGRKPAGSLGEGANRCLSSAADRAARDILYKVAYAIAVSESGLNDITINIKIANVLFNDVAKIESRLKELAGSNGEMFERSYKENLLEIVFTSKKTSREAAQFLSEHGFTVKALTNWEINADMLTNKTPEFVPQDKFISVKIINVPSFKKSRELENLLSDYLKSFNAKVIAKYQDNILELAVNFPSNSNNIEFAQNIAAFLEENKIIIEGASPSFVNGKLIPEEEKRGGLLW